MRKLSSPESQCNLNLIAMLKELSCLIDLGIKVIRIDVR